MCESGGVGRPGGVDLGALRRRLQALDGLIAALRVYLAAGGGLPVPGVCLGLCVVRRAGLRRGVDRRRRAA